VWQTPENSCCLPDFAVREAVSVAWQLALRRCTSDANTAMQFCLQPDCWKSLLPPVFVHLSTTVVTFCRLMIKRINRMRNSEDGYKVKTVIPRSHSYCLRLPHCRQCHIVTITDGWIKSFRLYCVPWILKLKECWKFRRDDGIVLSTFARLCFSVTIWPALSNLLRRQSFLNLLLFF